MCDVLFKIWKLIRESSCVCNHRLDLFLICDSLLWVRVFKLLGNPQSCVSKPNIWGHVYILYCSPGGATKYILQDGLSDFIATAIPEAKPPPLIAISTASTSGTCSSSSSPIVPFKRRILRVWGKQNTVIIPNNYIKRMVLGLDWRLFANIEN